MADLEEKHLSTKCQSNERFFKEEQHMLINLVHSGYVECMFEQKMLMVLAEENEEENTQSPEFFEGRVKIMTVDKEVQRVQPG